MALVLVDATMWSVKQTDATPGNCFTEVARKQRDSVRPAGLSEQTTVCNTVAWATSSYPRVSIASEVGLHPTSALTDKE